MNASGYGAAVRLPMLDYWPVDPMPVFSAPSGSMAWWREYSAFVLEQRRTA